MNKYLFKVELTTNEQLNQKEIENFIDYMKYALLNHADLPKEIVKKLKKIIEDEEHNIKIDKNEIEDRI